MSCIDEVKAPVCPSADAGLALLQKQLLRVRNSINSLSWYQSLHVRTRAANVPNPLSCPIFWAVRAHLQGHHAVDTLIREHCRSNVSGIFAAQPGFSRCFLILDVPAVVDVQELYISLIFMAKASFHHFKSNKQLESCYAVRGLSVQVSSKKFTGRLRCGSVL